MKPKITDTEFYEKFGTTLGITPGNVPAYDDSNWSRAREVLRNGTKNISKAAKAYNFLSAIVETGSALGRTRIIAGTDFLNSNQSAFNSEQNENLSFNKLLRNSKQFMIEPELALRRFENGYKKISERIANNNGKVAADVRGIQFEYHTGTTWIDFLRFLGTVWRDIYEEGREIAEENSSYWMEQLAAELKRRDSSITDNGGYNALVTFG